MKTRKSTAKRNDKGSVLIFVVGILVLLALSATAYLATTRSDRVTSKTHEQVVQLDLIMDGCKDAVRAKILQDNALSSNVLDFDNRTSAETNPFLASRVPEKYNDLAAFLPNLPSVPPTLPATENPAVWHSICAPLFGNRFESPTGQTLEASVIYNNNILLAPHACAIAGTAELLPVFSYDSNLATTDFEPALGTDLYRSYGTGANLLVAGDADGDGIADSLPVKVPLGEINGITYYVYCRVIDNGSAVNVNTAMSRDVDFSSSLNQTLPDFSSLNVEGYFVSNIGLLELLRDYPTVVPSPQTPGNMGASFNQLLVLKLTGSAPDGVWSKTASTYPRNSGGSPTRNDFRWYSWADYFDHQLAFRISNPGAVNAAKAAVGADVTDDVSLASNFILTDANVNPSAVETALASSLLTGNGIQSSAYKPQFAQATQTAGGWFTSCFNFDAEIGNPSSTWMPRRSLLTGYANFRNLVPTKYEYEKTGPLYTPGVGSDWMAPFPAGGTPKTSVNTASFPELFRAFWQVMAESNFSGHSDSLGTPFTPANGTSNATIASYILGNNFDPYLGMKFDSFNYGIVKPNEQNPVRMFRSPIRSTPDSEEDPNTPDTSKNPSRYPSAYRMAADHVLYLRAAIAALNLESLRSMNDATRSPGEVPFPPGIAPSSSPDIIRDISGDATSTPAMPPLVLPKYRNITLQVSTATAGSTRPVNVRIFGVQRQPYISEIYVDTDTARVGPGGNPNNRGYIAIELYNPYDIPIDITNCRFAKLHRLHQTQPNPATPLDPNMPLVDTTVLDATNNPDIIDLSTATSNLQDNTRYGSRVIVPAKGFLLLENYDASQTGAQPLNASYRPVSATNASFPPVGKYNSTAAFISGHDGVTGATNYIPETNVVFVNNLHSFFNREMILMRPLAASFNTVTMAAADGGAPTPTTVLVYRPDKAAASLNIREDYMPLDSYDFSGLALYGSADLTTLGTGNATAWHYQRDTHFTAAEYYCDWRFIYPGRYDAAKTASIPFTDIYPRQMGTAFPIVQGAVGWFPPGPPDINHNSWDDTATALTPAPTLTQPNVGARQASMFSIQLQAKGWPGINPVTAFTQPTVAANQYPFGKFARLGDIMQVPFIGTYMIWDTTAAAGTVIEANAVTMDAAMAEDTDPNDDPQASDTGYMSREQLGRFCPLKVSGSNGAVAPLTTDDSDPSNFSPTYTTDPANPKQQYLNPNIAYGDLFQTFSPLQSTTAISNANHTAELTVYNNLITNATRYRFASKLFDYFTIQAPHDDYFPNVKSFVGANEKENLYRYFDSTAGWVNLAQPETVNNSLVKTPANRSNNLQQPDGPNDADDNTENTEPVRGMININTAPAKVLAMVPWMPKISVLAGTPAQAPGSQGVLWWGKPPGAPLTQPADLYFHDVVRNTYFLVTDPSQTPVAALNSGNALPDPNDNEDIAKALTYWRDGNPALGIKGNGAFKSVFDLYQCPQYRGLQSLLLSYDFDNDTNIDEPDDIEGDASPKNDPPATPGGVVTQSLDRVRNDFEEQYLTLNRISNLVTTRSDSFTVYLLLQGWRNTGNPNIPPEKVVERRSSFIFDRSQYDDSNGSTNTVPISGN